MSDSKLRVGQWVYLNRPDENTGILTGINGRSKRYSESYDIRLVPSGRRINTSMEPTDLLTHLRAELARVESEAAALRQRIQEIEEEGK